MPGLSPIRSALALALWGWVSAVAEPAPDPSADAPSPEADAASAPPGTGAGGPITGPSRPAGNPAPAANPPPTAGPVTPALPPRPAFGPRSRFKSDLLLPFPSLIIPGFGEYFQGDWTGFLYTGAAVGGYTLQLAGPPVSGRDFSIQSWETRRSVLGGMLALGAGFQSAYDAFRTSVPRFQQDDGKYLFLERPEPLPRLLAAPFRFGQLSDPALSIPLGIEAAGVVAMVAYLRSHYRDAGAATTPDDFLFGGAVGYMAGVNEEAAFRGWLLPAGYENLGHQFWLANGSQALLFAALHYDPHDLPVPWPQALLGLYAGWLTRREGWSLSKSIFFHAWWDILLLAGALAVDEGSAPASIRVDLPVAW